MSNEQINPKPSIKAGKSNNSVNSSHPLPQEGSSTDPSAHSKKQTKDLPTKQSSGTFVTDQGEEVFTIHPSDSITYDLPVITF